MRNRPVVLTIVLGLLLANLALAQERVVRKKPGRTTHANLPALTAQQGQELGQIVAMVAQNADLSAVRKRWEKFIGELPKSKEDSLDVAALVAHVLREAYQETTEALQFHAEKVKYYNSMKKSLRAEVEKIRQALSDMRAGKAVTVRPRTFELRPPKPMKKVTAPASTRERQPRTERKRKEISSAAELEAYIARLEENLNTLGDDAQLANIDLQNMLQKQQQTMQTMSNVSKMLHDTAMAIIRKIG